MVSDIVSNFVVVISVFGKMCLVKQCPSTPFALLEGNCFQNKQGEFMKKDILSQIRSPSATLNI